MAKAVGLSLRMIQRIREVHRLQPHRIRTFSRSTDPAFAAEVEDVTASTWIRPPMRWSRPSTRNRRSRHSTALSQDCR
jgi:hypothetical protein